MWMLIMIALVLHSSHCWTRLACQRVQKPTHSFGHTLDLVLTYGVVIEHLNVFPQNPLLSDHNLITFEFILPECTLLVKSFYTRCLTDSAVAKFKEAITSAFDSIPRLNITEDSWANFSPSQIDHLVDSATGSLRMTLDSIASLKKKTVRQRRFAPCYNPQTSN